MYRNILNRLSISPPVALGIAVNVVVMVALIALSYRIPPVVPLFYGKPPGDEQLAASAFLLIPAVLALSFVIVNIVLARILKDKFLKNSLTGASLVVTTLSSITIVRITLLVGNL